MSSPRCAPFEGLGRRLRAGMNALRPSWLHSRRLRAEREAERVFEMSPALLGVAGFDGYLRRFNPAFEVFGYSREELLSRPWIEFVHRDDREQMLQAAASLERGADVVELENRVICRDGSLRWVEWSTRVLPEEGLFYVAGRDVTESRRAAEEQAALRRVATLVARETAPEAVFAAVGREVGEVLGVDATHLGRYDPDGTVVSVAQWGSNMGVEIGARFPLEGDSVSARVLRTGRPARMDSYEDAPGVIAAKIRQVGIRVSLGVPISVEGRTWGVMIATSKGPDPFPAETEARLQDFTELVATAMSNAQARAEVERLAEAQAALRRVATLVALESSPTEVFEAVASEVAKNLGSGAVGMLRFEPDGTATLVAQSDTPWDPPPLGTRFTLEGENVVAAVLRTRKAARLDDWANATGAVAEMARVLGVRSSVAAPIVVEGQLWGTMIAVTAEAEPLPADTEARIGQFTELVATAIANAEARTEVARLADEQAALRRVATLVAKQTPHAEVFALIAEEIGRLLAVDSIEMVRYEDDRVAAVVSVWGALAPAIPIGTRMPLGGRNVASLVFHTGRAARLDDYYESASGPIAERLKAGGVRAAVATPIVVEGRLWGAMLAASAHEPSMPSDTESRIGQFTELMATAIANAEARAEVARLADEQAALRRVATLVAHGAHPRSVFDAVTREVAEVLNASAVSLARYDDDVITVVAQSGTPYVQIGERLPLGGTNVTSTVLRTGGTARLDDVAAATGRIGDVARRAGIRSTVGAPVVVDGRTWGVLVAIWEEHGPPPDDTEERMARFAELLDTAIANADSRDQLTASRARVLAAGDDARRQVVRDLHDGAQQRLVHTIVTLKLAERALRDSPSDARGLVAEALGTAERATAEVRELAHGILPAVLTRGGLRAGVQAFLSRLDLPVDVDVPRERLPADIEASAYFIVAEALTNVVKHAEASRASVRASIDDGVLTLEVRDDGVGGADPAGHGLLGVADRVDALGGQLRIERADGGGTALTARLPVSS
jgi:PAS domain S-box-containing protein